MNTDPIADMLTRIRNANIVSHPSVEMPSSKLKVALAKLLKSEGFITDYSERAEGHFKYLTIELKYDEANKPVISNLKRVSKPGLRNYCKAKNLPQVLGGMGIAIVSTSKGLLTDRRLEKKTSAEKSSVTYGSATHVDIEAAGLAKIPDCILHYKPAFR